MIPAFFILMMAAVTATAAAASPPASPPPASPIGVWFPAEHLAAVEIAPCGPALCGRIVWIDQSRPPPGVSGPPIDRKNPNPQLRTRRVCGLEILRGFTPDAPGSWLHGTIYNPKDGEEWQAQFTVEGPDSLRLRGYVLIPLLGQSQLWTRAPESFKDRC